MFLAPTNLDVVRLETLVLPVVAALPGNSLVAAATAMTHRHRSAAQTAPAVPLVMTVSGVGAVRPGSSRVGAANATTQRRQLAARTEGAVRLLKSAVVTYIAIIPTRSNAARMGLVRRKTPVARTSAVNRLHTVARTATASHVLQRPRRLLPQVTPHILQLPHGQSLKSLSRKRRLISVAFP